MQRVRFLIASMFYCISFIIKFKATNYILPILFVVDGDGAADVKTKQRKMQEHYTETHVNLLS